MDSTVDELDFTFLSFKTIVEFIEFVTRKI